jgi:hypothetical protein
MSVDNLADIKDEKSKIRGSLATTEFDAKG